MTSSFPNGTWQSWFDAYGRKLVLFARQWASSAFDAEDIVQEAFVRFWRSDYRNDADAHVQLFAMVRRAGLDATRKRLRREAREHAAVAAGEIESWFVLPDDSRETSREVECALSQLPTEQREVVVLKIWGELTFEEIARSLQISPNTAASRYRYGLQALRKSLKPITI
jgi:RNA polymerase sigma-70 factor (ECF subfamily)